jgi:hypothetical protein
MIDILVLKIRPRSSFLIDERTNGAGIPCKPPD